MPSDAFAERILRFMGAKGYEPQRLGDLARAMGVGDDEMGDFGTACRALMKTGRVVLGSSHALMPPPPPGRITGTYRANPRGFGFVIPDTPSGHGDLYVPREGAADAITGDTVVARVRRRGKRHGKMLYEGRIIAIVKRGHSRFVGELQHVGPRWFVIPDGNTLHVPIVVDDPTAKRARPGDQVVVEIIQYPEGDTEGRGVIVKVLGRRGEPDVEAQGIVEQYDLPQAFDAATLDAARRAVAAYAPAREAKRREDLRRLTVVTIDPSDARDFDDAISITERGGGRVELGVHIADVAHFVQTGTALDTEARERANSVYLPNLVIPMLPEVLSNGVCSLQERQPRLAKSVFITYDGKGRVKGTRAANTIIRSAKRLTYEQVARVLDGRPGRMSHNIVALLNAMEALAKRIRKRRLRDGMLTLDLPDVDLVYDDDGHVVDAVPADTSFSHTIIEMFMVEANEAVARLLAGAGVRFLRRIHDAPAADAWTALVRFLRALGHDMPDRLDRTAVQQLLDRVRGHGDAFAVNLAVLRSLQRAEYAPLPIGHYALASESYTHFTSPIRRYPDLTVHRLLDRVIAPGADGRSDHGDVRRRGRAPTTGAPDATSERRSGPEPEGRARRGVDHADLVALGAHCSQNERRAESAERELKLVYVLRLLERRVGDAFDGVVTGVANLGVYVQLTRYLVDGLLRFDGLPDDWWEVDTTHGAVVGERSGRRIAIGDRLSVVVSRVNIATRQMDLALPGGLHGETRARTAKPTGRKTHVGKAPGGASGRKRRTSGKVRTAKKAPANKRKAGTTRRRKPRGTARTRGGKRA
ncbi:MAG: ribonuclease R family protein [Phycisphaerae bacterium]